MTGRRRPPRPGNKVRDAFIVLLDELGFSQPILSDAFHITSGRIKQVINAHKYPNRVPICRATFLAFCRDDAKEFRPELRALFQEKHPA